ncbi:MAG: hypothetical protein JXA69_03590 [Phycisphaerae bacterium]|nr:hypothetical protein [Phycisphaerae bacterium]
MAPTVASMALAASDSAAPSQCHAESRPCTAASDDRPIYGRSVTLDPTFAYYRDRTPASIAAEIHANGYRIVRCVLPADSVLDPELVDAFHQESVGVWYVTFGNGTYSTVDLPDGWESWRMVTRTELAGGRLDDGFTRLCLNNADYRTWKKAQIARTLCRGRFDGVDIAEPHWPEYPGFESRAYACFCPCCREAFRTMFPEAAGLPDILDADSPRSPKRAPELWKQWLAFREASLIAFLDDLVNGPGGIRERAPAAKVSIWTLALMGEDGLRRVREDSGEDAARIVTTVKPDLHCFQTHWPDWIRADLDAAYVKAYEPFIASVRRVAPDLPLMIQADTGSQKQNRRSWAWIRGFERTCNRLGCDSTTFYAYDLGLYMYTDPPRITEVRRRGKVTDLLFTKRLDPASVADGERMTVAPGRITRVQVDGSILRLWVADVRPGDHCTLTVRDVADDPARRLFRDHPPARLAEQTVRFEY